MPHQREQQRRAGTKGGTTTKERHGEDFFARVGQKGGATTKEKLGAAHYQQIGRRGGRALARQPEKLREAGRAGGKALVEKHGAERMRQLGAESAVERAARKVLPPLLAALAPFEEWLQGSLETLQVLQRASVPSTPDELNTLHTTPYGITFGDCARLLQALRAARGAPAAPPQPAGNSTPGELKVVLEVESSEEVPEPEELRDMLHLVDRKVPLTIILGWTRAQQAQAAFWASRLHLRAADNPVGVPPEPTHVKPFRPGFQQLPAVEE